MHQIRSEDHDNWYRLGCLQGGGDVNTRTRNDYVHAQSHQLSGNFRQPVHMAVCVPPLKDDVASFDIPEIAQAIAERTE